MQWRHLCSALPHTTAVAATGVGAAPLPAWGNRGADLLCWVPGHGDLSTVGDKFYIMFNGTADIYFKGEGAAVNRVSVDKAPQAFAQLSANRRRAELGRHVKTVQPGDSFGDVALRQVRGRHGASVPELPASVAREIGVAGVVARSRPGVDCGATERRQAHGEHRCERVQGGRGGHRRTRGPGPTG